MAIYLLVETAKLNSLKPYECFEWFLLTLTDNDINDVKSIEKIMP